MARVTAEMVGVDREPAIDPLPLESARISRTSAPVSRVAAVVAGVKRGALADR